MRSLSQGINLEQAVWATTRKVSFRLFGKAIEQVEEPL